MTACHLAMYLERTALQYPDRPAVVDSAGRVHSYRDLDDRAAAIAAFLRRRGIGRGDRVGMVLPKSFAAVAILSGVLRAGAAYVPIDWTAPAARNAAILMNCQVRALFSHPDSLARLESLADWTAPELLVSVPPELATDAASSTSLHGHGPWAEVLQAGSDARGPRDPAPAADASGDLVAREPDDLAYILCTSGSTGTPKGVSITHRNAIAFVEWCASELATTAEDRFSSHAPFHFDLSVLDLFLPQRQGAAVVLIPAEAAQSPRLLARRIIEQQLTVWYSTPSILSLLVQFGDLEALPIPALRLVLFAGEVFPIKHLRSLTRAWPRAAYYNLYGPTETNVCTFAKVEHPIADERTEPWPIGVLCTHCEGLVLDESGREVAPGDEGLLYIAGPSVFRGYWNRPDLDARVFLERHGKRWYGTGDVVRERVKGANDAKEDSGGGFVYAGRRDRMVKRRGYRIELGEIESALHRWEALSAAAVVAVPDRELGVRIVAYVTASGRARRISLIDMKSYCAGALPGYMNPDRFVFVDPLPRTSTDKIDYASLVRDAGGIG
ncbi:amino acid adenylation domain-containing protein [Pendulispora albinea]|uniref:Amino acid adenylation domain-containing protein n=1 Tax=Pendulispora albinea TaxID=2741071 RepID=A0ABZ2MAL9_9BACT